MRFVLTLAHVADAMHRSGFAVEEWATQHTVLVECFEDSLRAPATRARLRALDADRALRVWWCFDGVHSSSPSPKIWQGLQRDEQQATQK